MLYHRFIAESDKFPPILIPSAYWGKTQQALLSKTRLTHWEVDITARHLASPLACPTMRSILSSWSHGDMLLLGCYHYTCITNIYSVNLTPPTSVISESSLSWVMFLMTLLTFFIQQFFTIQVLWNLEVVPACWVGYRKEWLYNRDIYCKYHVMS